MFRSLALLLALSLAWGCSFLFIELALMDFSPLSVVFLRVLIGAGVLAVWLMLFAEKLPRDGAFWRVALLMGLFNNVVPFVAIVSAQTALNSGVTSVLNATMPFFTVVIALSLGEVSRKLPTLVGIALGFAGVVFLADWSDIATRPPLWALGLMIISAVSYSVAVYIGRGLAGKGTTTQAAAGMLLCSTLLTAPFAVVPLLAEVPQASVTAWLAILAMGTLSTALAYLFYFSLLKQGGATVTSLVTFMLPVLALALGATFLGERYGLGVFVGCALIFAGLGFVFHARSARTKQGQ